MCPVLPGCHRVSTGGYAKYAPKPSDAEGAGQSFSGLLFATIEALCVHAEQHRDAVSGPLGYPWCLDAGVQPGGHRGVAQVVGPAGPCRSSLWSPPTGVGLAAAGQRVRAVRRWASLYPGDRPGDGGGEHRRRTGAAGGVLHTVLPTDGSGRMLEQARPPRPGGTIAELGLGYLAVTRPTGPRYRPGAARCRPCNGGRD